MRVELVSGMTRAAAAYLVLLQDGSNAVFQLNLSKLQRGFAL